MENQNNNQNEQDMGPKSFFTHANGMKTAFDLVTPGEDNDTILVYFHGNQLNCRDRKARFALAKALGFKIAGVSLDNFGDGDSDGVRGDVTPLDWYNQAREFIREYLMAQKGYRKFYFVGMSVGGFICTLLLRDADDIMRHCLGMLLISPAWDFPLYKLPLFSLDQLVKFKTLGRIDFHQDPKNSYILPISEKMVEVASQISILNGDKFELTANVYIVWGQSDTTALPATFETFKGKLITKESEDDEKKKILNISWVPMGNHNLSRETDINIIGLAYDRMFNRITD